MILNQWLLSIQAQAAAPSQGALSPAGLYTWGLGTSGQLGDGTTVSKSSPVKIGLNSWTIISVGGEHFAGILSNGALFTWGLNSVGQLGDGTTVSKSSPVKIGALSWSTVVASTVHDLTIGIIANGKMYAWGNNSVGFLGNGTVISRSSPVVIGTSSWLSVSSANEHTAAIRADYSVWQWGKILTPRNELMIDNITYLSSPVQVSPDGYSFTKISAGKSHSLMIDSAGGLWSYGEIGQTSNYWNDIQVNTDSVLALRTDGLIASWGNSFFGLLGNGDVLTNKSSPVFIGTSSWSFISSAANTSYAIHSNGALYAWGDGSNGQIGDGLTARNMFNYDLTEYSWSKLTSGGNTNYGILSDGSLWAWGLNESGQLGTGDLTNRAYPVKLNDKFNFESPPSVVDVAAGFGAPAGTGNGHCLAIVANGALYAWGNNSLGTLGDGTTTNKSLPVKIGARSWTKVSAYARQSGALDLNGQLFIWGQNHALYPVFAAAAPRSSPIAITSNLFIGKSYPLTSLSFNQVSLGESGLVAVLSTVGELYLWGTLAHGVIGHGATAQDSVIYTPTFSYTQVVAGRSAMFGVRYDNSSVYGWGAGTNGFFGDGATSTTHISPVAQDWNDKSWSKIVAAATITAVAGITTSGTLWTWGSGTNGAGGRGTTVARSSPVQVGSLTTWSDIVIGNVGTTLALMSNGALYTWGLNNTGQIGDGTTTNRSSPVQIGSESWSKIAAGSSSSYAIHANGALYAWGLNSFGQLGDGTTVNQSSPIKIGAESWSSIASTLSVALAIHANGALYAWGNNTYGQLGNGTTVNQSSPIKIGSESWSQIGTAGERTCHGKLVSDSSNLYIWGITQLTTSTDARSSPVVLGNYTTLTATGAQTLSVDYPQAFAAINANGQIVVWGNNTTYVLGIGSTTAVPSPRKQYVAGGDGIKLVPGLVGQSGTEAYLSGISLSSWTSVSAGFSYMTAITSNGELFTWGDNADGQLGDGTTINKSSPVKIGSQSWAFIGTGMSGKVTLGIGSNGALYAWGNNRYAGTLGDGTTVNQSSPVKIGSSSWNYVAVGRQTSIGSIYQSSNLFGWGAATPRAANVTTSTGSVSSPVQIGVVSYRVSPIKIGALSWSKVAAGGGFALGLLANGQLYAWGDGTNGKLGDGTTISKSSPILVSTVSGISWTAIEASTAASYARHSNGAIYAWGSGTLGQLGDNTSVAKSSPIKIGAESWSQISAAGDHALGIYSNGKLAVWGLASSGQLGDNTLINKSSPIVLGAKSWKFISAGSLGNFAVDNEDSLFGWGTNTQGTIGDGTTVNKSSPVQVGASGLWWKGFRSKSGAWGTSQIIENDGALYGFGYSNSGSVGDGTTT